MGAGNAVDSHVLLAPLLRQRQASVIQTHCALKLGNVTYVSAIDAGDALYMA